MARPPRKRILVDVDSTIADLWTPWLAGIRERFGGDLRVEDVLTWDTHLYHPAGVKIYEVLEKPGLFRNLKPLQGALEALRDFHEDGWQVVVGTASQHDPNTAEKAAWIRERLPWLPKRQVFLAHGKELVAADVFVDDGPHNAVAYKEVHPDSFVTTLTYPYNASCGAYDHHGKPWRFPAEAWADIYTRATAHYERTGR